jgi:hypothetical protein
VVLDRISRLLKGQASWDFSEEPVDTGHVGSTGKFLRWRTSFTFGEQKKVVVFQEDIEGYLSVSIGGIVVIRHFKTGWLHLEDYERVLRELLK